MKSSDSSWFGAVLGVPGDKAIPSSFIKQVGSQLSGSEMAKLRLSPKNATGSTDLYSQNFSWGTSLVGLPGRSGLDVGFGIGYNSLVWIKDTTNNAVIFDPDIGDPTPGFRFGFPDIEPAYISTDTSAWAYMMVTPSGARKEFRQTAASNVYESADSSYTQLVTAGATNPNDPVEGISITVTATDGTQMTYEWKQFAYRCTRIMDRNGNYISITYDSNANLSTVTDTLGRVITVNYGGTTLPQSITQTWKDSNGSGSDVTHTWATFSYTTKTVATNFSVTVVGPPNDTAVTVLDKITYTDGSYTKFNYNGYVQVDKIENYAADNHKLNHVRTDLDSLSGSKSDCPRFTSTKTYTENFNNGSEVEINNTLTTGQTYSLPGGISGTATRIQVWMMGHPDNLRSNMFVGSSGWNEGLSIATEDCLTTTDECTDRKRWTWTDWTQDDTSASYIVNPRVVESRVGDGTNTKKSQIEYYPITTGSPISLYGLVKEQRVYDTDLTTVLKKSVTEYNLDTAYTSRRILGLPSQVEMYGRESTGLNLMSKQTFDYDEGDFSDSSIAQNISPVQHDSAYGSSFTSGRGNLTTTTHWNVEYPTSSGYAVSTTVKYNTAGSVVSQTTPWDGTNVRTVKIGYSDSFNSSVGVSTFAYPTTLTDPANHSSNVQYRYDFGANVEATSPAPAGQTYGKTSKRIYDNYGRLERNSIYVNTTEVAYTRNEFPANGVQTQSYTPVVDADGDGNIAEDEVYSESWLDGAGRVRMSRTEHPGSTGGWTATQADYDILGRLYRSSVPTEVSVSGTTWTPAGDDYSRGWLWTYQKYDWKGRVVRKINTDGADSSTINDSDILISYDGCGCAGGQVTTIQSENVARNDTSGYARRTQKFYEDILGRTYKAETMEWDGSTIYSTLLNTYNGRDQVTLSQQFAGTSTSSTHQDSTTTFDGLGRVSTTHRPDQKAVNNNALFTTYNYNPDGSVSSTEDARGATTSFTYNNLGLLTNTQYAVPSGSGIGVPDSVSFAYDDLGNRTQMTDALGVVDYEYDSLSKVTSETRDFSDDLPLSPISGGKYKLEYSYTLSGRLKSYTDSFGETVNYDIDRIGRLNSVSGTTASGTQTYASNAHYRSWGALTHLDYGNGTEMNVGGFNNKLQATTFEVKKGTTSIIDKSYDFYSDGSIKSETDVNRPTFDRLYKYDQMSRMTDAMTGAEARGSTDSATNIPFGNSFQYDVFSHQTQKVFKHFSRGPTTINFGYQDDRMTSVNGDSMPSGTFDVEGNQLKDAKTYSYDASNKMSGSHYEFYLSGAPSYSDDEAFTYSGDNLMARIKTSHQPEGEDAETNVTYQIRSTVLGGEVVVETNSYGGKLRTFIRANGTVIAERGENSTIWMHKDPALDSLRSTDASGIVMGGNGEDTDMHELDPNGNSVGFYDPYAGGIPDSIPDLYEAQQSFGSMVNGTPSSSTVDGLRVPNKYLDDMTEFLYGSIFGLLEHQANASRGRYLGSTYSWESANGESYGTTAEGAAIVAAEGGRATETRYWLVSDSSWAMNFSLVPGGGGQRQTQENEPMPGKDALRQRIVERLDMNNKKCRDFLDKVRENLKIKDSIESIFDNMIKKGGNVVLAPDINTNGKSRYGKGGKYIGIFPLPLRDTPELRQLTVDRYISSIFHELIHRGGATEGHRNMAQAAFNALTLDEQKNNTIPVMKAEYDRDLDDSYNRYFSRIMNIYCPPNAGEKNK